MHSTSKKLGQSTAKTPRTTGVPSVICDSRILGLVGQLGQALLQRAAAEQHAVTQTSAIEAKYAALKHSLAQPSREAKWLRKEIARLQQSLATRAGQRRQSSKVKITNREYLEQTLAQKNAAIRIANEQIAAGQVEINGQTFSAREFLAEMESRERELYNAINQRNPWAAFLIELFGDEVARNRQALEKRIGIIRKEYDRQDSVLRAFRDRLEKERDDVARRLGLFVESDTLTDREREIATKLLEERKKALSTVEANDAIVVEQAIAAGASQRDSQLRALDARSKEKRDTAQKTIEEAVNALNGEVHRLEGSDAADASTKPFLPSEFPSSLVLDWLSLDLDTGATFQIPYSLSFPLPTALRCARSNPESLAVVHSFLLRLFTRAPANALTVQVIDPLKLGASLGPFKRLLKRAGPLWGREVCTRAEEIERALSREVDRLEQLVQDTFRDGPDSWAEHSALHPSTRLPYRVVIVFDAPEQLTDKSVVYLQRLMEQGPRRGILPLVIQTDKPSDPRRAQQLAEILATNATDMMSLRDAFAETVAQMLNGHASISPGGQVTPSPRSTDDALDNLTVSYEHALNRTSPITSLWPVDAFWRSASSDGLVIPLGWTRDGDGVSLELGRPGSTRIHALVAGRSGSGKSSLLHVLLHSLCHRYSPEHVRVLLLDYKQGIEMAAYAEPPLPHADLVATESDISFGLTVLRHIESEVNRRAELFKASGATSIDQYCNEARTLPRLMLLIDEFQVLFSGDTGTTREVEKLLNNLLKQGRAYGLHIVLCTQTLSGINASVSLSQLTSQIAERLCLACDPQDSGKILAAGNEEGSRLSGPPEAILNSASGNLDANRFFLFPQPVQNVCRAHLKNVAQSAAQQGFIARPRIFRGDESLPTPEPHAPVFTGNGANIPRVAIGQTLSFIEEPLFVEMPRRPGMNLLIVGPFDEVRTGLLCAALQSLSHADSLHTVVIYNCGENPLWDAGYFSPYTGATITALPSTWSGDFSLLPHLEAGSSGLLIVDGLDLDRVIRYSKTTPARPSTIGSVQSPQATIADFLESGHKRGWRMIATAGNWRRVDSLERRDLLAEFQLRIGCGLTDEDYSKLAGTSSRLPPVASGPSRAILLNQHTGTVTPFRPFVSATTT